MKGSRARIAWIALLGMAWAALLPFTASARMLVADGPVEHCHRLNIDSVIDTDPAAPDGPSQPRKVDCPFCSASLVAPPPHAAPLPTFVHLDTGADAPALLPIPVRRSALALPPSRGPPATSRTAS